MPFSPDNDSAITWSCHFYKWRDWGSERLYNLLEATQPVWLLLSHVQSGQGGAGTVSFSANTVMSFFPLQSLDSEIHFLWPGFFAWGRIKFCPPLLKAL